MNILLIMSFAGTVLLILYFVVKHIFRDRLTRGFLYGILRVDAVFFLVPLILVGEVYKSVWADLVILFGGRLRRTVHLTQESILLLQTENGLDISMGLRDRILFLCAYFFIVTVIFATGVLQDQWKKRPVRKAVRESGIRTDAVLSGLQREYGIRRKVELCLCGEESQTATAGIFHPVIFFRDPGDAFEKRMLLSHELYHIKRRDILWRWLSFLTCCVHFWNPASYLLYRELMRLQERSCDEWVIRELNLADRGRYAGLLVKYSTEKNSGCGGSFGKRNHPIAFFGGDDYRKNICERVNLIMRYDKKNKIGKTAATLLMAGVLFASSLTALAYDDVKWRNEEKKTMADGAGRVGDVHMGNVFVSFETDEVEPAQDDYLTVIKIIDADGNERLLNGNGTAGGPSRVICFFHSYKNAKVTEHYTVSNGGGCQVYFYDAVICEKCLYVKSQTLTNVDYFNVCPHSYAEQ